MRMPALLWVVVGQTINQNDLRMSLQNPIDIEYVSP